MFVIAFLLMMAPHVSSQTYNPPCYYKSPDGEFTLDFSTLRGKRFVSHGKDPLGKEYSYYFTPCNTIGDGEIECVMDPEGVLTGMAIQRAGDDSCFVLGQFDSSITPKNWGVFKDSKGVEQGATLSTNNGSPTSCDSDMPRKLEINFVCSTENYPPDNTWEVLNTKGCDYTFTFPTKLACRKGQVPKPVRPNDNTPGPSFGTATLIIFGIIILLYFGLGTIYKLSKGATGIQAIPQEIFGIFTLAYEGSIYFFKILTDCIMSKHTTESNFNNDDSSGSMAMLNSTDRSNVKPYGGATYNEIEEDYVTEF